MDDFPFKNLSDIQYKDKNQNIGVGAFSEIKLVYHKAEPSIFYAMKTLHKKNDTEVYYIF